MQVFVSDIKALKTSVKHLAKVAATGEIEQYILFTVENGVATLQAQNEGTHVLYTLPVDSTVAGEMLISAKTFEYELSSMPAKAGLNIQVIGDYCYLRPDTIDGNKRVRLYGGSIDDFKINHTELIKIGEVDAKSLNNLVKLLRNAMTKGTTKAVNLVTTPDRLYVYGSNSSDNSFCEFFINSVESYDGLTITMAGNCLIGDALPNFEIDVSRVELMYAPPRNEEGNDIPGIISFQGKCVASFQCSEEISKEEIPFVYLNDFDEVTSRVVAWEELIQQAEWLKPGTAIGEASGYELSSVGELIKLRPAEETEENVRGLIQVTTGEGILTPINPVYIGCNELIQGCRSVGDPANPEFRTVNLRISIKEKEDVTITEFASASLEEPNAVIRVFNKPQDNPKEKDSFEVSEDELD